MYLLAGVSQKRKGSGHKDALDARYNLALLFKQKVMLQDAARNFELVAQGVEK